MPNLDGQDEERAKPHKPFCPKCGSTDIRVSQSHKTLDDLLRSFSLKPFRCRSCRKRFYLRRPEEPEDSALEAQSQPAEEISRSGGAS